LVAYILSIATLLIRGIVSVIPVRVELLSELGVVARKIGHQKIAVVLFSRAARVNPNYAPAIFNLALALNDLGDSDGAASCYEKSIQLKYREMDCEINLAAVLQNQGKLGEARTRLESVLSRDPSNTLARMNLAIIWSCVGLRKEALSTFQSIISQQPDHAMAHFAASLELLRAGEWDKGWKEYEWRLTRSEQSKADLIAPASTAKRWEGEDLAGKHILLRAEQGFGDTIQFCRFATELNALGAKVSLSVQPALAALVSTIKGVHQVCPLGKERNLDPYEFWIPLLSVPLWLKVTERSIPQACPYFDPNARIVQEWKKRLMRMGESPRIGLVWFGNTGFVKNWTRSFPLADFAPLASAACSFIALQCGPKADEAAQPPPGMKLFPVAHRLKDFSQTAGVIANLDLVVTVDTSVAHLAGALGKPVWTLLSFDADWRWLQDRKDSPWYPSMRLYRQTSLGSWGPVIDEVAHDLCALAANKGLD